MSKYVECVPNFSEGRDAGKIEQIVSAARNTAGVVILDVEKDIDHNRTVLSFVAPVETAVEACFKAVKKAAELIDLNYHKGEHPRMGAMDVAPFIPVLGSSIEDCITLAKQLGERIGKELQIPVYLYDQAALRPDRKDLAKVRKGQFEGLKTEIGTNPEKIPDFGPNKIHPTAGAMAVGAREQIINFNVNLDTKDMEFGKGLAKKIRTSGGGLPCLRAKEIFLESKGQVQISTVLTNYKVTSIKTVIDAIQRETEPKGIKIADTELIGLTTQEAINGFALETLKVINFQPSAQILESRLSDLLSTWQSGSDKLVDALSNTDPTPGGGSAAAVSGAMGCALGQMAMGISLQSKKLDEAKKPALRKGHEALGRLRSEMQACMREDSRAFELFMETRKIPKDDPSRPAKMQAALCYAAEVPLKTARIASQALDELKDSGGISPSVGSDYRSANHLLLCAIKCAAENVKINIESIQDKNYSAKLEKELESFMDAVKCGCC